MINLYFYPSMFDSQRKTSFFFFWKEKRNTKWSVEPHMQKGHSICFLIDIIYLNFSIFFYAIYFLKKWLLIRWCRCVNCWVGSPNWTYVWIISLASFSTIFVSSKLTKSIPHQGFIIFFNNHGVSINFKFTCWE